MSSQRPRSVRMHRCDRGGRVVGGMGAVPGFSWWPIKAYRPCPALLSAGFAYKRCGAATAMLIHADRTRLLCSSNTVMRACRKGQITDEMLFPKTKKREQSQ